MSCMTELCDAMRVGIAWLLLLHLPYYLSDLVLLFLKYFIDVKQTSQLMGLWDIPHRRSAKAQASLRIRAVSPEPSLFAHMKYGNKNDFSTFAIVGTLELCIIRSINKATSHRANISSSKLNKMTYYIQTEVKGDSRFLWNKNFDKNVKFWVISQYMRIFKGLCLCNEEHRTELGRWLNVCWFTMSSYIVIPYENDLFRYQIAISDWMPMV